MGRPPLPLGTWGKIRTYQLGPQSWRAIAKYKDFDGVTRPVERVGASKTKATTILLEALRDRTRISSDGEIKADTKMKVVARLWLGEVDESDKAARTKEEYRRTWDRYLEKSIGELRVHQVQVSTINRVVSTVRDNHGRGAAAHTKVVLSGVCGLAVRHDARDDNPVRELEGIGRAKRKRGRLVNTKTIGPILGVFHASEKAARNDLVDLIDFLSGVGSRIGEALALDWDESVDFEEGTITFAGTVIRVSGQGLFVQDHTKTIAGERTIRPAGWVMEILKRRYAERTSRWVFPSSTGTLRDPDNARKQIRQVVKQTPFEGLHPHDFRHWVADVLERAGLSSRQIADFLGHERISTTQEVYMERGVVAEDAGPALADRPEIVPPKKEG
ncbi:site-specific integrase [Amycolatopsis sp.]|uniref:site-specific integrase n=1 Tax=Amycolatopsis sp. TaxID=37632 RepID=UPI002C10BDC7|nr:site-specific integrase [Amycolatopsis sp.]HVV09226.1 site-specific integrase [Amycolatopsis sp.]